MRVLTQVDFLALWEIGRSLHPLDQAVLTVEAAFPQEAENVADWPIGQRNRALAELHCACFGPSLRGWTACRDCEEQLEFEINARALIETGASGGEQFVLVDGQSYRLPTSRDLAAVMHIKDPIVGTQRLLEQCCTAQKLPANAWNEEQIDAIGQSIAAADPLAEIMLSFDCPGCGSHFEQSLDLPSFVWAEIEGCVSRLLFDVHTLALAYGWSESDILSMSAARRGSYLKMLRA
jgi:hypothetical protein